MCVRHQFSEWVSVKRDLVRRITTSQVQLRPEHLYMAAWFGDPVIFNEILTAVELKTVDPMRLEGSIETHCNQEIIDSVTRVFTQLTIQRCAQETPY
jgi:hypothetical protein